MKYKITYANNFSRIFRLPNKFPSDYCFQGSHPVTIQLVDWFHPFNQMDFWGDKTKEFDSTDEEYAKHIEELRTFIREKLYFDSSYTYMALTDYGDAFVINPEKKANELQRQYDEIMQKAIKDREEAEL